MNDSCPSIEEHEQKANLRGTFSACVAYLKAMIQHICGGSNRKDHEEEDEEASLPVVGTDVLG